MDAKNQTSQRSGSKKRSGKGLGASDLSTQVYSDSSADLGDFDDYPRSSVERAQEIMYDAWEASSRRRRVTLAKRALETSPDCADAYVLLAEETAKSVDEVIAVYREGVAAGERALGSRPFRDEVGYFWGLLETRPYMRARAGLAQSLWMAGEHDEAVDHYWELLRLNPNDNQGIRDLLMPCLIQLGRDKDADRLYKRYKGNGMAVWRYSRALLDFRKHGGKPPACKSLDAALQQNAHVPGFVLGRRKMPRYLPDSYGYGDEREAVLYCYGNRQAWLATPGALEWLAVHA